MYNKLKQILYFIILILALLINNSSPAPTNTLNDKLLIMLIAGYKEFPCTKEELLLKKLLCSI